MYVKDIMTHKPLFISPDVKVHEAMAILHDSDVRHLPVVEDGEVIGIISDRDFQGAMPGMNLTESDENGKIYNLSVRQIMRSDVITVLPETPLVEAIEILIENRIGAIPVVSSSNALQGIVSYVDVLKASRDYFAQD